MGTGDDNTGANRSMPNRVASDHLARSHATKARIRNKTTLPEFLIRNVLHEGRTDS